MLWNDMTMKYQWYVTLVLCMLWCDVLMIRYKLWWTRLTIQNMWRVVWYGTCIIWYDIHKTMYDMNDTRFNPNTCLKGYAKNWCDMKENGSGCFTW